jgi:hypothetical protein
MHHHTEMITDFLVPPHNFCPRQATALWRREMVIFPRVAPWTCSDPSGMRGAVSLRERDSLYKDRVEFRKQNDIRPSDEG